jgi:hypothetical protein
MIYICILYLIYLETFLETLHSHFQPNCHFKMFKNSGSAYFCRRDTVHTVHWLADNIHVQS